MSKMYTPGLSFFTLTGFSVSVTRSGSAICAASTPAGAPTACAASHLESSNPARLQPASSMRASYSSPSYSLLARMGPLVVSFQLSSLATDRRLPSSYSTLSCSFALG